MGDIEIEKRRSAKIQAEVSRIIDERAEKQPLDFPSCGSRSKIQKGIRLAD